MTVPKWFIPVIAIVAAIAVGIAATLIGIQFLATPTVAEAPVPELETVPVIAPIDAPEGGGFAEDDDGGFEVSGATGSTEVVAPGDDDLATTDLIAETEAVAEGSLLDVALEEPAEDDAAEEDAAEEDGTSPRLVDPCAVDDPPADCEGLRSTILGLTALPPFTVELQPLDSCGTTAPEGSFQFGWRTSQPGFFTVRAWQSDPDSGPFGVPIPDVRMYTNEFATTAEDNAAWDEAREADTPVDRLPRFYGCSFLEGLNDDTYYTVEVLGVNRDGESVLRTYEFVSGGPFAQRAMVVSASTGSGGGWTASLVHEADQQFVVRAYLARRGDSDCTRADSFPSVYVPLEAVHRATATLSARQTEALGVTRDTNRNTAYGFLVPAGERVLFCGRLYRAGDAPSWERESPIRQYGQAIRAADYVLPVIQITDAELFRDDIEVSMSATTSTGYRCGSTAVDPAAITDSTALLLCQMETFGARWDGDAGRFESVIDPAARPIVTVVVRTSVELPDGTRLTSARALELPYCTFHGPCHVSDLLTTYDITLPAQRTGSGLCDSSWGPCDPPTRERASGLVRLTVSWPNAPRPGERDSSSINVIESTVPVESLELRHINPQMNTLNRITYAGVHAATGSALITLDLETDRAVDYRVELTGGAGLATCSVDGASLVATGSSEGETLVEIPGACFGALYFARVTLTDGDGRVTEWANLSSTERWLGSMLFVPRLEVSVAYSFSAAVPLGSALSEFDIRLDRGSFDPVSSTGTCLDDGILTGSGRASLEITSRPLLQLDLIVQPIGERDGEECTGTGAAAPFHVPMYLDTATLLRSPLGANIVAGPLTVTFTITPEP